MNPREVIRGLSKIREGLGKLELPDSRVADKSTQELALTFNECLSDTRLLKEDFKAFCGAVVKEGYPITPVSVTTFTAFYLEKWGEYFIRRPALRLVEGEEGERKGAALLLDLETGFSLVPRVIKSIMRREELSTFLVSDPTGNSLVEWVVQQCSQTPDLFMSGNQLFQAVLEGAELAQKCYRGLHSEVEKFIKDGRIN